MGIELDDIVKVGHAGKHFDGFAVIRLGHDFGLRRLAALCVERFVTEGQAVFEPGIFGQFSSPCLSSHGRGPPCSSQKSNVSLKNLSRNALSSTNEELILPDFEQVGADAFRRIKTAHEKLKGASGSFASCMEKAPHDTLVAGGIRFENLFDVSRADFARAGLASSSGISSVSFNQYERR